MSRPARRALFIAGLLLVAAGAVYWLAHVRADRTLERHAREAEAELAELVKHVVRRRPLVASEAPGDARPIYDRAIAAVLAIPEKDREILPENRYEDSEIDEAAIRAFIVKHQRVFDALEETLRADRMSADPRLAEGLEGPAKSMSGWHELSRFVGGAARNALATEGAALALPYIRMGLRIGADYWRDGCTLHELVGNGISRVFVNHARDMLAQQTLDAERLASFARDLDAIARERASGRSCWVLEGPLVRVTCATEGNLGRGFDAGWQDLWSDRLLVARGLDAYVRLLPRLEALDRLPPRHAMAEAEKLSAAFEDGNPLVRAVVVISPNLHRARGQFLMHWNLLRVSTALAWFRAERGAWPRTLDELVPRYLPGLEDCPLAEAPLRYRAGKVWSRGGDGDDDGGKPVDPDGDWNADGDVVWDLEDKTLPDPLADYR